MAKRVAVFRSKRDTIVFFQKLQRAGIKSRNRSIPSFLNMPCGICVEFDEKDFSRVKKVFSAGSYGSFVGFYPI